MPSEPRQRIIDAADDFRTATEPIRELIEWCEGRPAFQYRYDNADASRLSSKAYDKLREALDLYTQTQVVARG
jgi:hypothetical protein